MIVWKEQEPPLRCSVPRTTLFLAVSIIPCTAAGLSSPISSTDSPDRSGGRGDVQGRRRLLGGVLPLGVPSAPPTTTGRPGHRLHAWILNDCSHPAGWPPVTQKCLLTPRTVRDGCGNGPPWAPCWTGPLRAQRRRCRPRWPCPSVC